MPTLRLSALVFTALVALQAAVAAKPGPEARTAELMQVMKDVKSAIDGADLSSADREENQATFARMDPFFDYDRLSADTIAPHRKALSPSQLSQFNQAFRDLIRVVAFPRSGSLMQQAKVSVGKPKLAGGRATVDLQADVPEQDAATVIQFVWEDRGGPWRIVDVAFDGVSVVKDYQNQFGRLIKKDGAEGLLKRLDARLATERKAHAL